MTTSQPSVEKWKALAQSWSDVGPPASPSDQDLNIYSRYFELASTQVQETADGALMLGCTPSLRAAISDLAIPLTCVDISMDMLESTTTTSGGSYPKERLVCQDWLELDLKGSRFLAVVGDKFLDNVPYPDWSKLKDRLLRHLVPNGFLITRVAPQDLSLLSTPFASLLTTWAGLYEQDRVSLIDATSGLWEQALGASATSVPGKQSIAVFSKDISILNEKGIELPQASRVVLEEFERRFAGTLEHEWTSYTLGCVVDALAEELALVCLDRAKDYAAGHRQPVLMFQRYESP